MADIPLESIPPIQPPETLSPSSTAFVPQERPEAILGIIDEHPIPPGKPEEVLQAIADADISKKTGEKPAEEAKTKEPTTKGETQTEPEAVKPEKEDDEPPAKEKAVTPEDEEIKRQLKEVGTLLLRTHDSRASLVALSLSAGDTKIAQEFRKHTLSMIVGGDKIAGATDEMWNGMKLTASTDAAHTNDNAVKTFFVGHGYPAEIFDTYTSDISLKMQDAIGQLDTKGKPTVLAKDLKAALGWNETNPVPTTADELANHIGDDEKNREDMKNIYTRLKIEADKQRTKDTLRNIKGRIPTYLSFTLMGLSMLSQLMQEAESSPRGSH